MNAYRKFTTNEHLDMTPRLTARQQAMFQADKRPSFATCVIWGLFTALVAATCAAVIAFPAFIH